MRRLRSLAGWEAPRGLYEKFVFDRRAANCSSRVRVRVHWSTFSGHRILVVEHNYVIARHVSQILENEGASVFRASSVAQALRIADDATLSAGVLETRLGSEDCDPVCRALAQRNVPFIFHTSHDG